MLVRSTKLTLDKPLSCLYVSHTKPPPPTPSIERVDGLREDHAQRQDLAIPLTYLTSVGLQEGATDGRMSMAENNEYIHSMTKVHLFYT